MPLAVVVTTAGTPAIFWVHADRLGTAQKMTDATGAIVWDLHTAPFGELATLTATAPASNDNRFPGQIADPETGYSYNLFRDYDPHIGRYVQSDPIGLLGGMNTYAYGGGNPVRWIDPSGLDAYTVVYPNYQVDTGMGFRLGLGHAAVIAVNRATGRTEYYEFGRYGDPNGVVQRMSIPDVKIGPDGRPTTDSERRLRDTLSAKLGQGGDVRLRYLPDVDDRCISEFARNRQQDPNRRPYSWSPLNSNHCFSFAREAINACRRPSR